MAVFLLILVSTHLRPSELLRARVRDLHPRSRTEVKSWRLLVSSEESGTPTQTGNFSDSVLLDVPCTLWSLHAVRNTEEDEPLWDVNFAELTANLKQRTGAGTGRHRLLGEAQRNSGPPMDTVQGLRTIEPEEKKRRRWVSDKSIIRFEPRARLASEWSKLKDEQRSVPALRSTNRGFCLLSKHQASLATGLIALKGKYLAEIYGNLMNQIWHHGFAARPFEPRRGRGKELQLGKLRLPPLDGNMLSGAARAWDHAARGLDDWSLREVQDRLRAWFGGIVLILWEWEKCKHGPMGLQDAHIATIPKVDGEVMGQRPLGGLRRSLLCGLRSGFRIGRAGFCMLGASVSVRCG